MTEEAAGMDGLLKSLQALAGELKAIPTGSDLHQQLQQLLADWQFSRARVDHNFAIRLSYFLGTLSDKNLHADVASLIEQLTHTGASSSPDGPTMIVHPPRQADSHPWAHSPPESKSSETSTNRGTPDQPARPSEVDEVFVPLDRDARPEVVRAVRDAEERRTKPADSEKPARHPDQDTAGSQANNLVDTPVDNGDGKSTEQESDNQEPTYPEVERRVNSAYRLHLDRKHGEIEKLQELLAQKAQEAIAQNKEFGALLEIERAALEQASTVSEIDDMKQILIGGTDELIAGQRNLAEKLKGSFEYLEIIKSDSEQLHDELNKVRLLSLTDEHTGLPNRRAFMRRLDDEMSRSQRYEAPLALALIDLDFFKEINDRYGHPAGDAVLSWYAENALPIFRHYDMVARYGGEEFAVLFPGTTSDGARRALAKMRGHISGAVVEYDGEEIDVPTFSAGITVYKEGDDDSALIKRADKALYRAKSQGRDRIEIEKASAVEGNGTGEL